VSSQRYKHRFFYVIALAILILTGCGPQISDSMRLCPGKADVAEAVWTMADHRKNVRPFKGSGQCLWQYYDADDEKPHKENFTVKLWVNPPSEIYLQGDVAFDGKGIVLGSNEDEFWLSIKPEISSYWWGRWAQQDSFANIKINPKLMLEAFGMAAVENEENWSLSGEDAFDVLTKRDEQKTIVKKIYVDSCDYLVRRIEYFDANEQASVIVELDKYKQVLRDFFVPTVAKIINRTEENRENSLRITLKSVKLVNFTEKTQRRLFTRPESGRFKHIYKIINSDISEQP